MIWSHEGQTKCVVSRGSEIDEPRRFEYDVEAEPSNVEIPALDAFVRHDYRVQILDVHVGSSSEASRDTPEWVGERGEGAPSVIRRCDSS